ncbi:MAG TPA: TetR-like C-terminal domain-containing protein, partial [Anaerolineales bacterium]
SPGRAGFPSSARSISALFRVVEEARAAGKLNTASFRPVNEKYKIYYDRWRTYVGEVHPQSLFVAMIIWARVHGVVSLEIQGNLPPFGKQGDALYRFELHSIAGQFIKE